MALKVFTILTSLIASASVIGAAALPEANSLIIRSCVQEPPTISVVNDHPNQFKNNASALFGWSLSAIFGATALQQPLCNFFNNASDPISSEIRTDLNLGAVSPPLCLRTDCGLALDDQNIFLHILTYVRNVFNMKLLTALDNKPKTWLTMCNTLNSARLKGFLLQDTTIEIVCGLAGVTLPPNPDVGDNTVPSDVAVHTAASELLGWCLLTLFHSQSQITSFCNSYDTYTPNIAGINIDTTIINNLVCQYQTASIPTTIDLLRGITGAWTQIFAATLFAVSDSTQYLQFICKGYNTGHLINFVNDLDFANVLVPLVKANCKAEGVADI